MSVTVELLRDWLADESGATLVEYMMLASLVAVVCVSAVTLVGKGVRTKLEAPRAALAP
jgi:Flp pilus assembly pilin Flp